MWCYLTEESKMEKTKDIIIITLALFLIVSAGINIFYIGYLGRSINNIGGNAVYEKKIAEGKVIIEEFSDFQCPFCGRARPTVNQIIETYKDKVQYALRDFPLAFHQDAMPAHMAAHCAGEQGKYWEYSKILFGNQTSLKSDKLKEYSKQVGLDTKKFDECVASNKYAATIQKNIDEASKAGVTGTPSFFINGIMISGAQPFPKFKEIIDAELKK